MATWISHSALLTKRLYTAWWLSIQTSSLVAEREGKVYGDGLQLPA